MRIVDGMPMYKMRDGSEKPEDELFESGALTYNGGGCYEIPKAKEILFAASEIGPEEVETDREYPAFMELAPWVM